MSQAAVVFRKPFEVVQFWCSDQYLVHQGQMGPYQVDFVIDEPKPGTWFFQLSYGPGTHCVGDYLQPFLPTRKNISILNEGCSRAVQILEDYKRTGNLSAPKVSVFSGIDAYKGTVTRKLSDSRYRNDLFAILERDWGIRLPSLDRLGKEEIVLSYREGLPCGPAMVRAIRPVLQAVRGELSQVQQATYKNRGGRMIDAVEYRDGQSNTFTQNYDITEFYGEDLPFENFDFSKPQESTTLASNSGGDAEISMIEEFKAIIGVWHSTVSRGLDTQELVNVIFLKDFYAEPPDRRFNDPIEFIDFLHFCRTDKMLSDEEFLELCMHATNLGLDVSETPRFKILVAKMKRDDKKWWQFWKS